MVTDRSAVLRRNAKLRQLDAAVRLGAEVSFGADPVGTHGHKISVRLDGKNLLTVARAWQVPTNYGAELVRADLDDRVKPTTKHYKLVAASWLPSRQTHALWDVPLLQRPLWSAVIGSSYGVWPRIEQALARMQRWYLDTLEQGLVVPQAIDG